MTMAAATATPTDLVSDYIQQCLGFTSLSSKIRSLDIIQSSLKKCVGGVAASSSATAAASFAADSDADDAAGVREEWRAFLEDGHHSDNDSNDDDDDLRVEDTESNNNFMLRDSFIKCLVEGCHFPGTDADDDVDGDEDDDDDQRFVNSNIDRLVELSFHSLTLLASLHRHFYHDHDVAEKSGNGKAMLPIFGREFALSIAPAAVTALGLPSNINNSSNENCNGDGPASAASALLIELLHPNRPKCEARSSASILRDSILLPASSSTVQGSTTTQPSISSVARVAHVLSSVVIAAVVHATTSSSSENQQYGEEELSVREETSVLGKLQDMRDILANVGFVCSRQLGCSNSDAEDGDGEMKDRCAHDILDAIQDLFDIAPFAVESQLETLLDEEAKPILDRLRRVDEEAGDGVRKVDDRMDSTLSPDTNYCVHAMEDEEIEEGREQAGSEEPIPPLYASIVRPPILCTTTKDLDSMLLAISDNLCTTDAELWDVRLDALIDLERILAGGITYLSEEARYVFIERIRKMPLEEQFTDLRSQITQQACRVVIAAAYEYRDFVVEDMQLYQAASQLFECCLPHILTLCKSGTKLMANQGVSCLRSLFAVCGFTGYARTVPRLCEVILEKKAAKNQKRGCVIALTVALRAWDPTCFMKYLDQLTMAAKEGATNKDPTVREEGRKLYWAMVSACDETNYSVRNMFGDRSREMKNLEKERERIDLEWDEDGVMSVLVQTGVMGEPEEVVKEVVNASNRGSAPPRNSMKRPGAAARLRAMHGTPFKSQRLSTPMKTASTFVVKSCRKSFPTSASGTRLSTPNIDASSTSRMKASDRKSIHRASISSTPNATRARTEDAIIAIFDEEKENAAAMASNTGYQSTLSKSSPFYENLASPMVGTPIVNLMARASPRSAEKLKNTGDILGEIVSMLSDRLSPHEQSLGIKALALFAKENPCHPSWHEEFPLVLNCLLGKQMQLYCPSTISAKLNY
jgi:hypothetical protein